MRWHLNTAALLLVCAMHSAVRGGDLDAEFRNACKVSEVHCILIGEPLASGFGRADVKNWPELADELRLGTGPSERVWGVIPQDARAALENAMAQIKKEPRSEDALKLTLPVLRALQKTLERNDFYDEVAFKGVVLNKEAKDLLALGDKRTYVQALQLNRTLLALRYPKLITGVPVDYHVVRVKVKAGKDIALVLNSYQSCRWIIDVEDGGKVTGVLLSGYSTQEVEGVKAPTVYRAYAGSEGKWLGNMNYISNVRRVTDPKYDEVMGQIKDVTGKYPSGIQIKVVATKDAFIVKPTVK